MSRIGNAAATAALAGGVDGGVESRDLNSMPLIADLLGVTPAMFLLRCLFYAENCIFCFFSLLLVALIFSCIIHVHQNRKRSRNVVVR
jgi:hypothetical protein